MSLTDPRNIFSSLQVSMQNAFHYNNDGIQDESTTITRKSSRVTMSKKRSLEGVEDFNVDKRRKTAWDNTTSDNLNIGGLEENSSANFESIENNTIIENDLMDNAFNYDSIHCKISNLIELREVDKRDAINKLNFETKELKQKFYIMIKALNLSNYKDVSLTKIQTLLKGLEKFTDIAPSIPNSINKSDFIEGNLNYITVYEKITDLVNNKDNNFEPQNRISSLIFEPKSLKFEFYNSIKALNLANCKDITGITLGHLLDVLKHNTDLMFFDFHITEDDFLIDFKYNIIYNKVLNLINSGEVDIKAYVGNLKFQPRELKTKFYEQMVILELTKCKYVPATTIEQFMNNLVKFVDIQHTNDYSITNMDFSDDSLKYKNIYDKVSNLIDSNEDVNRNARISRLVFEPESLRKNFYAQIKSFEGRSNSLPGTLGALQN